MARLLVATQRSEHLPPLRGPRLHLRNSSRNALQLRPSRVPLRRLLVRVRGGQYRLLFKGAAGDLNTERQADRAAARKTRRDGDCGEAGQVEHGVENARAGGPGRADGLASGGDEHVDGAENGAELVDEAGADLLRPEVGGPGHYRARERLAARLAVRPVVRARSQIPPMVRG